MSLPTRMGAGLACNTINVRGVNVNQIQFGDKLQGLPPVTGRKRPYKSIRAKEGGNLPERHRIYCINQLGSIGMGNKNSQFAANADGVGPCPNKKNRRGWHGLHRHAIGSHHHHNSHLGLGSDKHDRANLTSNGVRQWEDYAYDPTGAGGAGMALTSFPSFLATDFDVEDNSCKGVEPLNQVETLGGTAESNDICPAYAPYPYSGKRAGQPSSPQPAWCCEDFTNPTSGSCSGAHVKCDPADPTNWTTCETYTSTCPASYPYPYNGKTAGQPSPEEVPQAWCCATETSPTSGGCGAGHVKCDPESKAWVTCKEYDPPTPGPTPDKKTNIIGYWWNCSNPKTPIPSECDTNANLIMLASFCPNPFSLSHCEDVFGMAAHSKKASASGDDQTFYGLDILKQYGKQINDEVNNGERNLDPYLIISIGGSSFGLSDWMTLAIGPGARIKNETSGSNTPYQCPENSYQATKTNIEDSGCKEPWTDESGNTFPPYTSKPACAPYIDTDYITQGSDHACECNAGFAPYPRTTSFGGQGVPDGSVKKCTGGICGIPWYSALPLGWQNSSFTGGKIYSGSYDGGKCVGDDVVNGNCPGIFDPGQGVSFGGDLRQAMINLCQKQTFFSDTDVKQCNDHYASCDELLQEYVRVKRAQDQNITDIEIIGNLPQPPQKGGYITISTTKGINWASEGKGLIGDINFQLLVARDINHPIRAQDIILANYPCSPPYEGSETTGQLPPALSGGSLKGGASDSPHVGPNGETITPAEHWKLNPFSVVCSGQVQNDAATPVPGTCNQTGSMDIKTMRENITDDIVTSLDPPFVLKTEIDENSEFTGIEWEQLPYSKFGGTQGAKGNPFNTLSEPPGPWSGAGGEAIVAKCRVNCSVSGGGASDIKCVQYLFDNTKDLDSKTPYLSSVTGKEEHFYTGGDVSTASKSETAAVEMMDNISFRAQCLFRIMYYSGAHGFDLDYEGLDSDGLMGIQITLLMIELKTIANHVQKDVPCILTMTPLSGTSYGTQSGNNVNFKDKLVSQKIVTAWQEDGFYKRQIQGNGKPDLIIYDLAKFQDDATPPPSPSSYGYGWPQGQMSFIYQSFLYSDCPYDYVLPMLYDGGQYPWSPRYIGWTDMGTNFSWNGLMSYWCDSDHRILRQPVED